jgi:AcrR family transcriptional regulator
MVTKSAQALKPRKMPRQARSEATVTAILEATIQVLLARGVRRLTTTRVAQRAGVSVGTMYQYFPHKEALFYAVLDRSLGETAHAVEKVCDQNYGQPLGAATEALVTTYVDAKISRADAARMLYMASSDLEMTQLVNAILKRMHDAVVKLLASVPDAHFKNLDGIAFSLLATLIGGTRVAFVNPYIPINLKDFRHRMVALCRAFLRDAARPAPPRAPRPRKI